MLKIKVTLSLLIYFSLSLSSLSDEKEELLNKIADLNTLEFTFDQIVNNKIEKGICQLEFPGKLKCLYFDEKQKELIINNGKLAITQKRYNKTYYYPFSKSPFLNILYKEKLLEIIKSGRLEKSENKLQLIYDDKSDLIILFNKSDLELSGWKIIDQYNNEIVLNLKIISRNSSFPKKNFQFPEKN